MVVLEKASVREPVKVLNMEELVVTISSKQHVILVDDNILERKEVYHLEIMEPNINSLKYVIYIIDQEEKHAGSLEKDKDDSVLESENEDFNKALVLYFVARKDWK